MRYIIPSFLIISLIAAFTYLGVQWASEIQNERSGLSSLSVQNEKISSTDEEKESIIDDTSSLKSSITWSTTWDRIDTELYIRKKIREKIDFPNDPSSSEFSSQIRSTPMIHVEEDEIKNCMEIKYTVSGEKCLTYYGDVGFSSTEFFNAKTYQVGTISLPEFNIKDEALIYMQIRSGSLYSETIYYPLVIHQGNFIFVNVHNKEIDVVKEFLSTVLTNDENLQITSITPSFQEPDSFPPKYFSFEGKEYSLMEGYRTLSCVEGSYIEERRFDDIFDFDCRTPEEVDVFQSHTIYRLIPKDPYKVRYDSSTGYDYVEFLETGETSTESFPKYNSCSIGCIDHSEELFIKGSDDVAYVYIAVD